MRLFRTLCLLLPWSALLAGGYAAAAPVLTDHVEAELIAEHRQLQADGTSWVALRLKPESGWHVYWRNPGDSGLPTELQWQLPEGIRAGEIQWPYPHAEALGTLTNYGYGDETLHLVELHNTLPAGTEVTLQAKAKWLVCKDICIPGSAELSLPIGIAAQTEIDSGRQRAFAEARDALPRPAPAQWQTRFAVDGRDLHLAITGLQLQRSSDLQFFPYDGSSVNHAAPQRIAIDSDGIRLSQARSAYAAGTPTQLAGVVVLQTASAPVAFEITAAPGDVAAVAADAAQAAPASTAPLPASFALILGFALLGGIILNLMPCVFPVLSLKAVAVMGAQGEDAARHRAHALSYTAGVVLSFVAVAGLLLALRAGGAAIGWGFQLQSPVFVGALVYLMFALGLSLAGAVEFGTRWMGVGQKLTERPGLSGSFFTGVLAVVVASPCTAPFMGTALGFALTQSPLLALPVFATLGLGLALPFLLLGFVPQLAARLPRPGAWMETFKQALAFPLMLTAVWLLWVLGGLSSRHGMALVLCGLVALSLALWLMRGSGRIRRGLSWLALTLSLALLAHPLLRQPAELGPSAATSSELRWEPYSDARFDELRAQGRSVFVDFTADWCITCKFNERVAIDQPGVRQAVAEHDVAMLMGDWTRSDPAITAVLRRYERSGVPLYLVSHHGAEASVLPQLLTESLLVEALTPPPR